MSFEFVVWRAFLASYLPKPMGFSVFQFIMHILGTIACILCSPTLTANGVSIDQIVQRSTI